MNCQTKLLQLCTIALFHIEENITGETFRYMFSMLLRFHTCIMLVRSLEYQSRATKEKLLFGIIKIKRILVKIILAVFSQLYIIDHNFPRSLRKVTVTLDMQT